jgi:hypothetical protein
MEEFDSESYIKLAEFHDFTWKIMDFTKNQEK